jgi:hypothetical protein
VRFRRSNPGTARADGAPAHEPAIERRENVAQEHEQAFDEGPSLLSMVRIVAIGVALIILVSFAAGYGFGRLFL